MQDLEQSIRKLQLEISRQTSDIKRLEMSKAQLDSDHQDKSEALSIEMECGGLLDQLAQDMDNFMSAGLK